MNILLLNRALVLCDHICDPFLKIGLRSGDPLFTIYRKSDRDLFRAKIRSCVWSIELNSFVTTIK